MPTFDQLSDEQRAIVELVLQQGKSYDELSAMLDMPEARVRELARDALIDLAPISARGVEEDWRGQLADYVLGQQVGPEATATRGHLRRSEAARSWTRSLLDSLEQLYPNGDMPAIPDSERGSRRAPAPAPQGAAAPERQARSPEGATAVSRRRIAAAAAAAGVVILLVVLVWPIGVLTGGDGNKSGRASSTTGSGTPINTKAKGTAIVATQGGKTEMLVTATGLKPTTQNSAYQVWLYNSNTNRKSLGATVTNQQGQLQAGSQLPSDYRKYQFIDVTTVSAVGTGQKRSFKSGASVLRGLLQLSAKPVTQGTGKNRITVLAQVTMSPLPGSGG